MKRNKNNGFDYLSVYDNFYSFFKETEERIFRFRLINDPSQQQTKAGIIREAIPLGSGDILLGFAMIQCDVADASLLFGGHLEYYRLSELRLEYYPSDVKEYNYGT